MSNNIQVLKAYYVQGDEYGIIRFATSNVVARREGANELEEEFNCVSCKRFHGADKYAELGRVPSRVLVEEFGFWQECTYCRCHVDEETEGRVWVGDSVYCDMECEARWINHRLDCEAERKRTHEAEQAAIAEAEAKFPGITDVTAYIGHKKDITVYFRFPGGLEKASWTVGENHAGTSHDDGEAFKSYINSIRQVEADQ
ncbi:MULTISPECIES: hypothetical protein [Escherichia]|uniref:Uncharacterized protein n=1 Tax=Escherichia coli TaxID=562 RepID=A0AAW6VY52_ECOLX|nr:hypothetical protein [Escherichia coli]EEW1783257.1 hypothetical protein [Escherichia coli]EFC6600818.1 hypothetical protein [Escherichia coli]EFF8329346.1 hypothetical protein [Escherichia coli]MCX9777096.1 hypothetical protein [Escherichia coli]MDK2694346.1 hypothetical protein [Escherichia coli]